VARLEAVMNLLRNGLLMLKTKPRRRNDLTEEFAFLCGLSAEFITLSNLVPMLGQGWRLISGRWHHG
jgi:hypothetical protein